MSLIARFMGPIWGPSGADRQDPGGSHVGPMNFAIWDADPVHRERNKTFGTNADVGVLDF